MTRPLLARYAVAIRDAAAAAGTLRLPGGAALEHLLALAESDQCAAAERALAALPPEPAFAAPGALVQALLLDSGDRRDAAIETLEALVLDETAPYEMLCLAADLLLDWDRPDAARAACDRAIGLAPHASHAWLRRGRAQAAAGDLAAAIEDLRRATLLQPNLTQAHAALGDACRDAGMPESAIAAYRAAVRLDPDDLRLRTSLDAAIVALVPPWHTAMLNDRSRNAAFDTAIRRAVSRCAAARKVDPADIHVLDIGTGSGLLAMMAARAGAGRVTACESVGPLAGVARDIVARNGYAERIAVIHKRSFELVPGEDLPRPADLLVAEICDAGLLGEGILAAIADARARLLRPGAAIIPRSAALYALPIECAQLDAERRVDRAAGFDIAPFNALRPRVWLQTDLARYEWRPLAAPAELFRFDFTRDGPDAGKATVTLMPDRDGTAHAIALWFRLGLDDKTVLATGPMDPPTHWKQAVIGLDGPVAIKQGEPVCLHARHDARRLLLRLGPEEGPQR